MGFFRKKAPERAMSTMPTLVDDDFPWEPSIIPGDTDWSDLTTVQNEWKVQPDSLDEDMLAWRNGHRMADLDEHAGQRFNEAEYISRAVKHHLDGNGPLSDEDLKRSLQRIFTLLHIAPTRVMTISDWFPPMLVRLVLTIARSRGWQPVEYGGDGSIDIPKTAIVRNCSPPSYGAGPAPAGEGIQALPWKSSVSTARRGRPCLSAVCR